MKERLYRILKIKHSEANRVFDLLTVQFFLGLANAFINIIALILFIKNFEITYLPIVYLVIAATLFLFNFLYEKFEHEFTPLVLLKYIIAFGALLMITLWIGLSFGNTRNFIFIFLVAGFLIYMLCSYAFWGLVSTLFNVRESRRVFSIVGSGDIPAKLIGYVAAPLLIPFFGLQNLIWLPILALITGFYLFNRFTKRKDWELIRNRPAEGKHRKFIQTDLVSFFFQNRLIFAISLISILSYNVFILVDYTFISQVKHRFENITDLAAYIAMFFAFGRLVALIFKLIFTSRVIEKLGIIYCLFITPVALFLFCMLFFVYGDKSVYDIYIFGLMAMITEVLRSTMQEPVFFILFQPLKENLRLKGHMISKGYMYPPALIIVGMSLLLLHNSGAELTILLSVKVVIINLCIWAIIIFFMRRIYLGTIHASIKKGIFNTDDIYIADEKTINILLNKIDGGKRNEVIYALDLLEKSAYAGMNTLLEAQLKETKDLEIRKYALERLNIAGMVNAGMLNTLLQEARDMEWKQKLISVLCKYDSIFLKNASGNVSSYDDPLKKIIIINLLNQPEFNYLFTAGNEIKSLLSSANSQERILAIEIITELKHVQFSDAIEQLINDDDIAVKRNAILAACTLKMRTLLPAIIGLLDNNEERNIVLKGLQLYGDTVFTDLPDLSPGAGKRYAADLIKIAGKVKGACSVKFLVDCLDDEKPVSPDKIVHALWVKDYNPAGLAETQRLRGLMHGYIRTGLDKLKDYKLISDFSGKDLVKRTVFAEVKNDLSLALKACSLLFRKKEINRILELMEIYHHEKLYNAMEMLELVLPNKLSKELNLLFDFILDPQQNHSATSNHEMKIFYNKVLFNNPLLYNSWTKAVCLYCSWKNHETAFLEKVRHEKRPDGDWLVNETRDYILAAIK